MDALGFFAALVSFFAALLSLAKRQTRAHGLAFVGASAGLVTAYRAL